jgi:hypothetical protein
MFSLSESIVLLWLLPVVLQIGIPLVILTIRLLRMLVDKIIKRQKDQSVDIDFRLLDSAG